MIIHFTNFVQSASSFFKDNVEANAKYIVQQMNKQYGKTFDGFYLMIQTDSNQVAAWRVWMTTKRVIASRNGINKVNPSWSYLFWQTTAPIL